LSMGGLNRVRKERPREAPLDLMGPVGVLEDLEASVKAQTLGKGVAEEVVGRWENDNRRAQGEEEAGEKGSDHSSGSDSFGLPRTQC